ncbi:MAG: hypothetical protein KAU27_01245 [Desulfuromonadales bacterium]|nr:hypothetical protein [Desulfuromonadales bacterium]
MHKLDPRVKVLSCLLLVVLAFAATGWAQLFTLIVSASIVFWLVPALTSSTWRLCWLLRWLLLFTLLMHLFFSPGRTLWGLSWLSLDGLLMGVFVSVQMLLAIIVSALLAITTSTKSLAGTFGWFVQPLQWMGCRTEEWQKLLLLTMDFIPVVQTEIRRTSKPESACSADSMQATKVSRWSVWAQKLQDLLARLVDRGDTVAHRIAANEDTCHLPAALTPLLPLALLDQLFSLVVALVITCYWLAG